MSRFVYLIYGTAVLAITTLINLSEDSGSSGSSRGWSSGSSSSGSSWYSSGHHK